MILTGVRTCQFSGSIAIATLSTHWSIACVLLLPFVESLLIALALFLLPLQIRLLRLLRPTPVLLLLLLLLGQPLLSKTCTRKNLHLNTHCGGKGLGNSLAAQCVTHLVFVLGFQFNFAFFRFFNITLHLKITKIHMQLLSSRLCQSNAVGFFLRTFLSFSFCFASFVCFLATSFNQSLYFCSAFLFCSSFF